MAKWGEIKCPRCAAPPIALWDALARQLEESDAREARMETRIEELEAQNRLLRDAVYIDDLTVTGMADDKAALKARIEELEAKLALAVEALEKVQAFVRDLEPYADQGNTLVPALEKACTILAELKGQGDE